jgi:hypothetical protein
MTDDRGLALAHNLTTRIRTLPEPDAQEIVRYLLTEWSDDIIAHTLAAHDRIVARRIGLAAIHGQIWTTC